MLAADIHAAKHVVEVESETDELTEILNLRGFHRLATLEHAKAVRYGRPYAILMVDADNLKAINDTQGHEAGNRLLRMLANLQQQSLRSTDLLARYGGDEFVLMLVGAELDKAREVAERICDTVGQILAATEEGDVSTTVSVGVAAYPQDGELMADVMERADQAMYRSKQGGRNKVTVYS